ncbi:MAG: Gx transporter family protein [Clostridia bacterium]|nr:Gx transporter family protein [Clostridia bacterium]
MKKNIAYKTALSAILCALALSLGFLESLIPPIPLLPPGAKPGLSNIITMFAAGSIGLAQAIMIVVVKGCFAFVTRGFTAGIMSLSGGIFSAVVMYFLLKYSGKIFGLIGISVLSALAHNIGQLFAAVFITGTASIAYYAPALAVFGIATGAITGVIFKAVIPALDKLKQHFFI